MQVSLPQPFTNGTSFDNEDVILSVENTPTYKRTRQMLEDISNQASGATPKKKDDDENEDVKGVITFA